MAQVIRRVACGFVASVAFAFAFLLLGAGGLSAKVGRSGGGFGASGLRLPLPRGRVGASVGKVYGVLPVGSEYGRGAVLAVGAGCQARLLRVDARGDLRFVRLLAAVDPAMPSCGLSFASVTRLTGIDRDLVLESPAPSGDCEVMPTVLARPGRANGSFGPGEVVQSRASDASEAAGRPAMIPAAAPGGRDLRPGGVLPACGSASCFRDGAFRRSPGADHDALPGDFYSGGPRAVTLSVFTEIGPAARARASSPDRRLPLTMPDPAVLARIDCSHGVSACLGGAVLRDRGRPIGRTQFAIAAGK